LVLGNQGLRLPAHQALLSLDSEELVDLLASKRDAIAAAAVCARPRVAAWLKSYTVAWMQGLKGLSCLHIARTLCNLHAICVAAPTEPALGLSSIDAVAAQSTSASGEAGLAPTGPLGLLPDWLEGKLYDAVQQELLERGISSFDTEQELLALLQLSQMSVMQGLPMPSVMQKCSEVVSARLLQVCEPATVMRSLPELFRVGCWHPMLVLLEDQARLTSWSQALDLGALLEAEQQLGRVQAALESSFRLEEVHATEAAAAGPAARRLLPLPARLRSSLLTARASMLDSLSHNLEAHIGCSSWEQLVHGIRLLRNLLLSPASSSSCQPTLLRRALQPQVVEQLLCAVLGRVECAGAERDVRMLVSKYLPELYMESRQALRLSSPEAAAAWSHYHDMVVERCMSKVQRLGSTRGLAAVVALVSTLQLQLEQQQQQRPGSSDCLPPSSSASPAYSPCDKEVKLLQLMDCIVLRTCQQAVGSGAVDSGYARVMKHSRAWYEQLSSERQQVFTGLSQLADPAAGGALMVATLPQEMRSNVWLLNLLAHANKAIARMPDAQRAANRKRVCEGLHGSLKSC